MLWMVALIDWFAVWRDLPRRPWVFTLVALAGTAWLALRIFRLRRRVQTLKLGRDGERAVGQFLEGLREGGARIFHDVPAEGFNLDHVVISTHGIYVVEPRRSPSPRRTPRYLRRREGHRGGVEARPGSGQAGCGPSRTGCDSS